MRFLPAQKVSKSGTALRGVALSLSLVAAVLSLGGCGSSKPQPAPLERFQPVARLTAVWTQRVAQASSPVSLSVAGNTVTVSGTGGEVAQFALDGGKVLWRGDLRETLSAGVGSDGRFAAVVTAQNELVVLDRGAPVWRERQPGRVITAPLVAGERVFVQGVDRAVRAYDVRDGRWLWQYQRPGGEALALSSQSVLMPFRDTLLVGQGARLVGLDPLRGTVRFDASAGTPRGTNEVERLADLIGPAARADDEVCVRAFQFAVACFELNRGSLRWSRPHSGTQAVAASDAMVVGADGTDRLTAWKAENGDLLWRVDRFTHRGLSAPAIWGDKLAVVDAEGYLHLLALADGRNLARFELDGPLAAAPVVVDPHLLVLT
ncbi:MAG: PQQ-binding-like beta-propeller repeat protein, partial [Aquabacterium sp.]